MSQGLTCGNSDKVSHKWFEQWFNHTRDKIEINSLCIKGSVIYYHTLIGLEWLSMKRIIELNTTIAVTQIPPIHTWDEPLVALKVYCFGKIKYDAIFQNSAQPNIWKKWTESCKFNKLKKMICTSELRKKKILATPMDFHTGIEN